MAGAGRTGLAAAEDGFNVTPNDGVDLAVETRALLIGGAGTVAAVMKSGASVSFTCVAGQRLDVKVTRVLATGTTATGVVALV